MELRKKIEIIMNDKTYLTKENITYAEKQKILEEKIERIEEDLLNSKKKNSSYLEQLLN